ncbi:desmoplakin isoform X1 [Arapaima gigas]
MAPFCERLPQPGELSVRKEPRQAPTGPLLRLGDTPPPGWVRRFLLGVAADRGVGADGEGVRCQVAPSPDRTRTMSLYDSQNRLHTLGKKTLSRGETSGTNYMFTREVSGGNGFAAEPMNYTQTFTRTSTMGCQGGYSPSHISTIQQKAVILQDRCLEAIQRAEIILQTSGVNPRSKTEVENLMAICNESTQQLKMCAMDLQHMGQSPDNILKSIDFLQDQIQGLHYSLAGTVQRKKSIVGYEEPGRNFQEAISWINQQKRLIETSPWGDDPAAIQQQISNQKKFHSSIQRSIEVDRAKDELRQKGDKPNLHILDQEWDSLQRLSSSRGKQLQDLQNIIEEISREIMWVNEREEEELVFDWSDKNIDTYIPKKQESYSKLMRDLEEKEKDLNKLKQKAEGLLRNNHPASDKIEAYTDTLQTQWSWLLQITKCIDVHLKENAAYSQFFKEANETYSKLQKQHENIRQKFTCDRGTSLDSLLEMLKNLEREKERIMENKRQVQLLVNKSKNIVRLKPRNPEEKSSSPVVVQALCDFKQDQKVILKGDEAILKDNLQRSKWLVTGPGGLDMLIPSVCLLVPPPNPISITLANKNEQYYEAILGIWNQLFINIKSLISWQYCIRDITRINSLTLTTLAQMRPEEYRSIIKSLETHYQEFRRNCLGSEMFGEEDKRNIETQYNGAQTYYDSLVVLLPGYGEHLFTVSYYPSVNIEKPSSPEIPKDVQSKMLLTELHSLRQRLEMAESGLTQHLHLPLRDDNLQECSQRIIHLESIHRDMGGIRNDYMKLKAAIQSQLQNITDADKAKFLKVELDLIDKKLGTLDSFSSSYLERQVKALRALFQYMMQAEDIIKVYEARLTEKDTTSLDPNQVEEYKAALKQMKAELEQKKDLISGMENELRNVTHWNDQINQSFHKCDVDLSKYAELVGQMSDRWHRILTQISTRQNAFLTQDMEKYLPILHRYLQTSSSLDKWIDNTHRRQDSLQSGKFDDIRVVMELQNKQKMLNSEIKGKREDVEDVKKDANTCAASIKDYELQLTSYGAGLETLLNIPVRKTLLQSPSTVVSETAADLHTRYIELLTQSGDYYKFLGEMVKNMEELKMRNTKIDLLEEDLRLLKGEIRDRDLKNKSLEDAIARYQLELTQSKEQLLTMEEVKKTQARQCDATKEDLNSTFNQLKDLNEQVARLTYQLDEEKRKRKLAEERYTNQQEEYELVLRKRQKELEEINWGKIDIEKTIKDKEREIERLRRQLEDEMTRQREIESELSKVRTQHKQEISNLKTTYESEIQVTKINVQKLAKQKEEDSSGLKLKCERLEREKNSLEEELRRLRLSMSQAEELRKRVEEDALQLRSTGTEESRRRRELEIQIQTLTEQRTEDDFRYKESLAEATKTIQEKNRQITLLTQNLEEETRKKKILEAENSSLKQIQTDLKAKYTASVDTINKLKLSEQETSLVKTEVEKLTSEKSKSEQHAARLQSRIKDLQQMVDELEAEVERHKKEAQDETTRRKRLEAEIDRMTQSCREYTNTINVMKRQQEEGSLTGKRNEQELRRLQDELDKSLRDHKATKEKLDRLTAELKVLQQQLQQEQARVKEANLRNETLYKTIEEKSKVLNDNATEIDKLQTVTQNLTKERLRLEEELRALKAERDELKKGKDRSNSETMSQISSLQLQLQTSSRNTLELQRLIDELNKEKANLKKEMEKIQKQAIETSNIMHNSQTHYNELVQEKESLLLKIKMLEQDKSKLQRYEDELNRIKVTLESEQRQKQRLLDENMQINRDFNYWKSQYELKEEHVRKVTSEKDSVDRERNSLKNEIARLMSELKMVEDRYKLRLNSTEKEITDLKFTKESLEKELRRLSQLPVAFDKQTQTTENETTVDSSKILFDGVRKKVSASQLCDCGIIDNFTVNQLLKGQKTVQDVAIDIQLNLKGTGVIAGIAEGPQGKMPITEAKKKKLITPESATMLLEAQAATGYIIDPRLNKKMAVDEACSRGLVDPEDRDSLIRAECAATGFKDPYSGKVLSVGQAMKKGHINRETALRLLQAQEAVGGILDPVLSVFLPSNVALERSLIDEDLYRTLNKKLAYYIDPETQQKQTYIDLKLKSRSEPSTGLLLLPAVEKKMTVRGLRIEVLITELYEAGLLDRSDLDGLREGRITIVDIEKKLRSYLQGSTCIAGIYDESKNNILSIYKAMKEGLLRPGTTLELLEAQAASGFIIDPVSNQYFTVEEAVQKGLVGREFKEKLLSAERAVTGYTDPHTGSIISLFQAMEKGLIEKGHGIRLLEAQIASGGIIDPKHSHRINVDVAYKRGYFDEEMNDILSYEGDDTKGFFDPNTEENLTYLQLKKRCITDEGTGLVLLPLRDKSKQNKTTQKKTLRKRRVVIVDPDTKKEMTVREAYGKQLIDYETYLELSEQESEWEEITITGSDGSTRFIIIDRKTGIQHDIQDSLNKGIIDQATFDKYRSGSLTLTQFADTITRKASPGQTVRSTSVQNAATYSSPSKTVESPFASKHVASVSIMLSKSSERLNEQSPIGAIFDTETLEKITITEALRRGIVDSITAQRLLEAQACTGGIINPATGKKLSLQDAVRQGIINDDMATRLKSAQKAYLGFEDVKFKRKLSVAEAMKEKWVPYEAGQRFLEFQYVTGGLIDPEFGQRRSTEDAVQKGWLEEKTAQKLQDTWNHTKNLTCPKTKLKISYKEAMDNCMVEEYSGLMMLQASSISSKGISSPYNMSPAPGSQAGSRSGSRRGSVDLSSKLNYSFTSFSSSSLS